MQIWSLPCRRLQPTAPSGFSSRKSPGRQGLGSSSSAFTWHPAEIWVHCRGFKNISSDCFTHVPTHPSPPPSILKCFLCNMCLHSSQHRGEDTAQNERPGARSSSRNASFAVSFPELSGARWLEACWKGSRMSRESESPGYESWHR